MSPTVEHGAALDSVLVHHHRSATGFTNHPALSDSRESASVERASLRRGRTRLTSLTFLVKLAVRNSPVEPLDHIDRVFTVPLCDDPSFADGNSARLTNVWK